MANRRIVDEEQVDEQAQQAQEQQAATQEKPSPQAPSYTKKDAQGNDIPWYPAPAGHASQHMTAIAARGQEMFNKREDPGLPDALAPVSPVDQKFVPMPNGGVMQLAEDLFPGDVRDNDAMRQHVFDLMLMNRDRLRTDTDYVVGQQVRIK